MKYGFIIDNRKCIGCHACTVSCKSEHEVSIGVNRTWVKYIEKGTFPDSRRVFTVMRCNHCVKAPCVNICPVGALFRRDDGIIDFNNERCIGCKSCIQACPYDAVYIDPDTDTAAKCNFCAHRIDSGRKPACVVTCPEQAIVMGDLEDPRSEINRLLSREQIQARKVEKGVVPKLYYIEGDATALNPMAAPPTNQYQQFEQAAGVGHYAKFAQKRMAKNKAQFANELSGCKASYEKEDPTKYGMTLMNAGGNSVPMTKIKARRSHDAPSKGILWGWELPAYLWTKAIAAGSFILMSASLLMGYSPSDTSQYFAGATALTFLVLTLAALVKDLDKPSRFLYVLLRPQWSSWLARGAYFLVLFGASVFGWGVGKFFEIPLFITAGLWAGLLTGLVLAVYTAFLLGQAKGRDFWQSSMVPFHMLTHSLGAGSAFLLAGAAFLGADASYSAFLAKVLGGSLIADFLILMVEITMAHPGTDSKLTVKMIKGRPFGVLFWLGSVVFGIMAPLAILYFTLAGAPGIDWVTIATSALALTGIYITEHIWIRAPQLVAQS